MAEDIPGFERDPEMEKLLDRDVLELDEDTRADVQLYKSRLLQAKRDAGMSGDTPPWAEGAGTEPDSDSGEGAPESQDESPSESDQDPDETDQEDSADDPSPDESEPSDDDTGEEIPGFETDPELEKLLEKDIQEIDEDKRVEVQKYKSRKMKAKQKASDESDEAGSDDSEDAQEPAGEADDSNIDFEEDPELEELLDEDIMDLPEEKRVDVQKYKSRKMKAKRAAREGEKGDTDAEDTADESDEQEKTSQPGDEKKAPPADDQKRHDGERKIKELVESRTSGREVSRRGFLSSLSMFSAGVAGFLGVLGIGGTATGRFFFPNVLSDPPEQFVAGDPEDYPTNTVSDEYKGQYRVWIVNLGDRIVAINAICTHLGCTPNWLDSQGIFKCPCHGSGYYMNGVNFEGPAPRPMDRVGVRLSPTGKIIVDKSMQFSSQASPGWEAKDASIPVV